MGDAGENVRPLHTMTLAEAQGIASMEVVKGKGGAFDNIVEIPSWTPRSTSRWRRSTSPPTEQIRLRGSLTVIDEHATDAELWLQIEAIYNTARARMGLPPDQLIVPTLETLNVQRAPDESKPERAAKVRIAKQFEKNAARPSWNIP